MEDETRAAWWQMTRTAKQGFFLAGLNLLVAVLCVVLLADDEAEPLEAGLAAVFFAIAAAYWASSLALRKSRSALLHGRGGCQGCASRACSGGEHMPSGWSEGCVGAWRHEKL